MSTPHYRAFQCFREDGAAKGAPPKHTILNSLPATPGGDIEGHDTTVQVDYSSMNYKDALAVKGVKTVMRINPLIPGIDLAGTVIAVVSTSNKSSSCNIQKGDKVLLTGWGAGETHHGGYQTQARVKADQLIPIPSIMDTFTAMSVGTAGYTAMLCIMALENAGLTGGGRNVVVSGACGGVGSLAILLLSQAGYNVSAITGRPDTEKEFLEKLGATQILDRNDYFKNSKSLSKEKWDGAIDTTGSKILATILSEMKYGASVAACGLAAGMDLPTTVAPFILRNVSLLGIDSVQSSNEVRTKAWNRLAEELKGVDLEKLGVVTRIGLNEVVATAETILAGKIRGRTVVDLNKEIDSKL